MSARAAMLTAQTLDALTFVACVTLIPTLSGMEVNPLIGAVYTAFGAAGVVVMKVGISAYAYWAVGLDERRHGRRRRWVTLMLYVAAVSGMIGATMNTIALVMHR